MMDGDEAEEKKFQKLVEWMSENGFKSDLYHLHPVVFPDTGRGLACRHDIQPGETVLEVPKNLIITTATVMSSNLGDSLKRQGLSPLQVLCIFLMCQYHLGADSPWCPYIRVLPRTYTTPLYWSEPLIRRLPQHLRQLVTKQWQTVSQLYTKCRRVIRSIEKRFPSLKGRLTYDKFRWAWSTVNTRCVYWKQELNPHLNQQEEDHYALVPLLDLLNHSASVQVEAGYNPVTKHYTIATQTGYRRDAQVFIHYGPHTNTKLLMEYGFILPNNCNDVIDVDIEDLTALVTNNTEDDKKENIDIIFKNNLHRGLACTSEGFTWSLLTALQVAALSLQELSHWPKCMENTYTSEEHKNATFTLARQLVQKKKDDYAFELQENDGAMETVVAELSYSSCNILESCLKLLQS